LAVGRQILAGDAEIESTARQAAINPALLTGEGVRNNPWAERGEDDNGERVTAGKTRAARCSEWSNPSQHESPIPAGR
jgi:hypothetical protein